MPPGRPRTGRATYAFVRLREETHKLWLEVKRSLAASSDDALACCLLQNIRRNVSSSALKPLSTPVAEVVGTTQR